MGTFKEKGFADRQSAAATADLITTLVASAFVDGGKEKLARNPDTDAEREDRRWRSRGASRRIPCPRGRAWSADLHGRLL